MILSASNIVSFLCDQVFLSLFVYLDQPAHCMRVRLVGLPLCAVLLPFVTFSTSEYGSWLDKHVSLVDENCACGEKKVSV